MAKYSSDSDSDRSGKYRRRHYRRSRSSSSDSSDSSSYRRRPSKYSKSRRHRRSRSKSRERPSKSYKSSRGSSKDRDRRRYKSPDRSKKKRSPSREKSTSRSSSSQSYAKSSTEKNFNILAKDEFTIEPRINESVLEEINSSSFTPKQFTSSAQTKEKKINKNIVIDITGDTIQVPPVVTTPAIQESIFHTSIMMDQEARFDRWVKKLYNLRQKAMTELASSVI